MKLNKKEHNKLNINRLIRVRLSEKYIRSILLEPSG
jgi:hypothetical protein